MYFFTNFLVFSFNILYFLVFNRIFLKSYIFNNFNLQKLILVLNNIFCFNNPKINNINERLKLIQKFIPINISIIIMMIRLFKNLYIFNNF